MKNEPEGRCGGSTPSETVSSPVHAGCGCAPPPVRQTPSCCGSSNPGKPEIVREEPEGPPKDRFIVGWVDTPVGQVPRVGTKIEARDVLGRWRMRWGIGRGRYRISPGLYAVGDPGPGSHVLVTANYKMTFDALRRELGGMDAWILVLETYGINVWCAAGKGTFGTDELVRRVNAARLEKVVSHRRLILPQLGAPGVSAHRVGGGCGFGVEYGPVYARDIKRFIDGGLHATPDMRRVAFPAAERIALMPVEIVGSLKPAAWMALALFIIAGIGPDLFSPAAAWQRWFPAIGVLGAGIMGGAVVTPLLLPWLPCRTFSAKGALAGAVIAAAAVSTGAFDFGIRHGLPFALALPAISSFVAMNFTGATPFTSPSGVEKEMRRAMPVQAALAAIALVAWVAGTFIRT